MAEVLMVAGDDFEHPMFAKADKVAVPIPLSATVKASLVGENDGILISATSVSAATAGSDWPSGKMVVKFTNVQTGAIPGLPLIARVAAQVETAAGAKTTFFSNWHEVVPAAVV